MIEPMPLPLIIAHRGASAMAPENTLAAFRRAIEAGSDGIEFDVRLARDGVPVVIHDASLKRTANIDKPVSSLTSAELERIDVGRWFATTTNGDRTGEFPSENISTLARALRFLQSFHGRIFVELKCPERDLNTLAAAVCSHVKNSPLAPQIIIKSFRLEVIRQVRVLAPGIRTAALFAPKVMALLRKERHMVRTAKELGADELSIHYSLATAKLMERAGDCGLPVTIWTTDKPRWIERALQLGVRSLITNDPQSMLSQREAISQKRHG